MYVCVDKTHKQEEPEYRISITLASIAARLHFVDSSASVKKLVGKKAQKTYASALYVSCSPARLSTPLGFRKPVLVCTCAVAEARKCVAGKFSAWQTEHASCMNLWDSQFYCPHENKTMVDDATRE